LAEKAHLWTFGPDADVIVARYADHKTPPHFHDTWSIGCVVEGSMGVTTRGGTAVAARGTVVALNAFETHCESERSDYRYVVVHASGPWLMRLGDRTAPPRFGSTIIRGSAAEAFARACLRLDEAAGTDEATALLVALRGLLPSPAVQDDPQYRAGRDRADISRACEFVKAHYADPLSLRQLAAVAQLSPFHFLRVFQQQTGVTPATFLRQVRTYEAKRHIRLGLPLVETALHVGFADQSHLTRRFKAVYGVTPGDFARAEAAATPRQGA